MKRRRRSIEVFNLSFLDVISCGFGAIVLLLVIMKISEPVLIEESTKDISLSIARLRAEAVSLRDSSAGLYQTSEELRTTEQALLEQIGDLNLQLAGAREQQKNLLVRQSSQEAIIEQLYRARQELTEEMLRLQRQKAAIPVNAPIGGIPVDSEFIIFVIDTSGSMQQFAWPAVRKKMQEILSIYPRVQGIQVMNDMGDYMFSQYVEGITAAIRRFYAADKKISIYVFGDDFSRGSIQEVVDTVDSINRSLGEGSRRVRIHAVGFPVLFGHAGADMNVARFAALMRRLAEDNDGSFVGLTEL
ncbi:MAG: hypothetical protein P8X86_15205 [Desulfofustis sp.]